MVPYATQYDYVESQIEDLGLAYVANLIERGFVPMLTDRGWKWVLNPAATRITTSRDQLTYVVDTESGVCQASTSQGRGTAYKRRGVLR